MGIFRSENPYGLKFGSYEGEATRMLIIINIMLFVLIYLFPGFPWLSLFGFQGSVAFFGFRIWQFFTYMFLHLGLWHLVLNMLMLLFFGLPLEEAWGRNKFISYYFFSGLGAAFFSLIFSFKSLMVGASGAIFGVLLAYALMFPESVIVLFFIFPLKTKPAVLILATINFLGAISSGGNGVTYLASLGGALFGYLYLKSEWLKSHIFHFSLANFILNKDKSNISFHNPARKSSDSNVDAILDKISKYGMQSLTKREQAALDKASRKNNHNISR
jgi:membrane associated rhomboid family serine protease